MWKRLAVSMTLLAIWPAGPGSTEVMPCDPTTVGSMWKYSEQSALGSAEVTRLVTSNQSGVITVSETSIRNYSGMQMKQEQVQTLHEQEGAIVLKEVSVQNQPIAMELKIPLCGSVELESTFLGSETVEVPAGRFNAEVYEVVTEGAPMAGGGMAPTRHWSTIYFVPGIGTVKSLMVNEVPAPTMPQRSTQNPEAAALMQEGIAAMQKGEDPAKIFERLANLQQPAAGDGSVSSAEMRKNTITRELIEFAIE